MYEDYYGLLILRGQYFVNGHNIKLLQCRTQMLTLIDTLKVTDEQIASLDSVRLCFCINMHVHSLSCH